MYSIGGRDAGNRLPGLDALRTLAIVGVTLFHLFPETVCGGYLGVSLFFVLTGYLLAYTSARARSFSVPGYYLKRIRRIYPPLLIVLLSVTGAYSFLIPTALTDTRAELLSVVLGYNNWWQIAQNADYFTRISNASPFTHLWFLGIELQYYLVWPLLFLLYRGIAAVLGKGAGIAVLLLLGAGSAALMPLMYRPEIDVTRLYYGTDTRVYALLFGAALGLMRSQTHRPRICSALRESLEFLATGLLFAAVIAAYLLVDGESPLLYRGGMLVMTLVFCLLIHLATRRGTVFDRVLDCGLFRWVGKRSYGIFLWQYPVIFLFQQKGWDAQPLAPLWETLAILLLSMWLEALVDGIRRHEFPVFGRRLVFVQSACFFLLTVGGLFLMGFGCRGIAAPVSSHAEARAELEARWQANAAQIAQQNERAAAEEAAARQRAADERSARIAQVRLDGVACIGDSVMLSAAGDLQRALPGCAVDAEVSRYVGGGLEAAQALAAQGRLGRLVVVSLGTNGPIAGSDRYEVQTKALLDYLGPNRQIFWVNVYCPHLKWQETNNAYIAQLAAAHPNVTVVDWYGLISQHPEWLTGDGVHPSRAGAAQYAQLIRDKMAETLAAAP